MSEIDWAKAPEGATHYAPKREEDWMWRAVFWRIEDGRGVEAWAVNNDESLQYYENPTWIASDIGRLIERPSFASWTGTGLPPVGTVCEMQHSVSGIDSDWIMVKINYCSPHNTVATSIDGGIEFVAFTRRSQFRPIRTQAQIEAEEREKAIDVIQDDLSLSPECWYIAKRVYDAGYRKQGEAK